MRVIRHRNPCRDRIPGFGRGALAAGGIALTLGLAGPASSSPFQDRLTGESVQRDMAARDAAAMSAASLIRQAHERISAVLLTAPDENLLRDLRASGLPAATASYTPFTAAEATLYADLGIAARICGPWLVTTATPNAHDSLGWISADEVIVAGALDRVTASGGIKAWNRPDPDPADLALCSLPTGAPAVISRWRAPAAERRAGQEFTWKTHPCPVGEVGSGIISRQRTEILKDGFGTETSRTANTWEEMSRDCRPPRTGSVTLARLCPSALGGEAVIIESYPWTEQAVGPTGRDRLLVETVVDYTSPSVIMDHCGTRPAEEVEIAVTTEVESRSPTCLSVHGAIWDLGTVQQWRCRYDTTTTFPPSWSESPRTNSAFDPWERRLPLLPIERGSTCADPRSLLIAGEGADNCARRETRTVQEGGCAGILHTWTHHVFADPVPHQADYEVPGTRVSTPYNRCPPPGGGSGGGGDGDNGGESGYRDQHGNTHRSRDDCSSCNETDRVTDQSSFDSFTDDS